MSFSNGLPPGFLQSSGGNHRVGWTGPWPPPQQMILVETPHGFSWRPLEDVDEAVNKVLSEALAEEGFEVTVTVMNQVSASEISDADIVDMTHVVRGADYERGAPWSPAQEPSEVAES